MSKLLGDLEMPIDLWPSNTMKVLELMEIKFSARQKEICTAADLMPRRTS